MHAVLLTLLLARSPLPIPQDARTAPTAEAQVEAPPPVPLLERRRVAISLGVGTVIGWPSLELEVLPLHHLGVYVAGELSVLAMGYGAQAGVRLRPLKGLGGPWLDLHLRHSHFAALTFSLDEAVSPGAMAGFSVQSRGGFLFSAGLGVSFMVRSSQTRYGVGLGGGGYFPVPVLTVSTTSAVGPQPELKLQVGWAF